MNEKPDFERAERWSQEILSTTDNTFSQGEHNAAQVILALRAEVEGLRAERAVLVEQLSEARKRS